MTESETRLLKARADFLDEQRASYTNAAPVGSLTKEGRKDAARPTLPARAKPLDEREAYIRDFRAELRGQGRSDSANGTEFRTDADETDSSKALAKARTDFLDEQAKAFTNAAPAGALTKEQALGARNAPDEAELRAQALQFY